MEGSRYFGTPCLYKDNGFKDRQQAEELAALLTAEPPLTATVDVYKRQRQYQAILPIRGKILNVEKASMDKVLANAEIKTMINTFGCGFSEGYGNDFDITKLRYDKIILMTLSLIHIFIRGKRWTRY